MILKKLELSGFKSFAKKTNLDFNCPISAIVGPNGSGKSNIAEAFRFVLGEQSFKSMRGKRGEDMIFSGSSGVRRANLAEVSLVFDNSDRRFSGIDFDEVRISRVVHRDGENNYYINGSKTRLKDVIELLSAVNIGVSAHHIISQGETDRILNAKPVERKSMIEEALGLKVYQYKRKESEKKLIKTEENLKEVKAIRRELAPRISFLKEQVKKVERARSIQEELVYKYKDFLKREYIYIFSTRKILDSEKEKPQKELEEVEVEISRLKEKISHEEGSGDKNSKIVELEDIQRSIENQKGEILKEIGRLEGEIQFYQNRLKYLEDSPEKETYFSWDDVSGFVGKVDEYLIEAKSKENVEDIYDFLETVRNKIREFLNSFKEEHSEKREEMEKIRKDLFQLENEKENKRSSLDFLKGEVDRLTKERRLLQEKVIEDQNTSRQAERRMFECMNTQQKLRSQMERIQDKIYKLENIDNAFKYEIQEAVRIIGSFILEYKDYEPKDENGNVLSKEDILNEDRNRQEERRKEIERLKIRLEELSVGSHKEIMDEYKEVSERDEFLMKEVSDLEHSIESLRFVITDLENTIQNKFEEGLKKINVVFQQFFSEMFGGGTASLQTVLVKAKKDPFSNEEEEEESESTVEGLEISVSLPRKNVKGLLMLSGGERALVSTALIFAMSQVNPPPFLILDETDAALDEANSHKYGTMVEHLADHSQLILITHNRETMARAGVLYGITMDSSGVSKVLSVKLGDETE